MLQRNIIKGILFVILLLNILRYYIEYNSDMSFDSMWLSIGVAFLAIVLYLIKTERVKWLKNNSIDIIFIICLGVFVVHFFEYISYMIGSQDSISYFELFNKKMVNSSMIVSSSALVAFVLGSLFVEDSISMSKKKRVEIVTIDKQLEIVQFACLVVFFFVTDKRYFLGGYNSIEELSNSSYLSQQVLQACMYANLANKMIYLQCDTLKKYFRSFSLLFYVTNFIYLFLIMISGDRGPILYMTVPFVFSAFIICRKTFSFKKFAIFAFGGILFLNFLGAVRSLGEGAMTSQRLEEGFGRTQERLDGGIFFGSFRELSGSIKAYNILYKATEEFGPIYGIGIIDQSIGIIPGLRYILYPQLGIDTKEYSTANVSTLLLGEDHGMGTTCVGDVFFNVGFVGTILIFLFFGYVIRKLNLMLYSENSHYFFVILGIGYMSYAIYIGRGSFFSTFNVCGYAWMLYFLLSILNKKIGKQWIKKYC